MRVNAWLLFALVLLFVCAESALAGGASMPFDSKWQKFLQWLQGPYVRGLVLIAMLALGAAMMRAENEIAKKAVMTVLGALVMVFAFQLASWLGATDGMAY